MVCRVAEKAWKAGHCVLVQTVSTADTARLDQLLWTFRQDSFVPHDVIRDANGPSVEELRETRIWLGAGPVPPSMQDVLINLTDDVPLAFTQFARIAEVVDGSDDSRSSGRERFRYYRDSNCDVHTHNL